MWGGGSAGGGAAMEMRGGICFVWDVREGGLVMSVMP